MTIVDGVRTTTSYRGAVGVLKGAGGGRSLIFNGHVDVVPPGDAAIWSSGDPFSGRIEADRIWGRGATDMKGGLLAQAFGPGYNGPLQLVAHVDGPAQQAAFRKVTAAVAKTSYVARVTTPRLISGVATADVYPSGDSYGKLREPILRFTRNLARFPAEHDRDHRQHRQAYQHEAG